MVFLRCSHMFALELLSYSSSRTLEAIFVHLLLTSSARWPKTAPRRPQDGPRRPQDCPRRPQDGPRRPQDAPKMKPNTFKNHLCLHTFPFFIDLEAILRILFDLWPTWSHRGLGSRPRTSQKLYIFLTFRPLLRPYSDLRVCSPIFKQLGAILGRLGAVSGTSWDHLGLYLSNLGPMLDQLGVILDAFFCC